MKKSVSYAFWKYKDNKELKKSDKKTILLN